MTYNSIEEVLRSESKPDTFVAVKKVAGCSMARVRAGFLADANLYSIMYENKENKRRAYKVETVAKIEAIAKREGITHCQASKKAGLCGDTHARFTRELNGGSKPFKIPKYKDYAQKILEGAREGAVSVLEAARKKGVPPGAVHGAIGDCKEIHDLVKANANAEKDKRYREAYSALCERIAMGETIHQAADNLGLSRNLYYRCRKHLGVYVKPKAEPAAETIKPSGLYNRLLMGKLTGQSSAAG